MFKEFKNFLFRGNLLDLATAVILGTAFGAVVTSLVSDIITPIIAALGGEPDFSRLVLRIGDGRMRYGNFLNALLSFVMISAVIFLILKAAARAQKVVSTADEQDQAPPATDEAVLLAEIRDLLRDGATGRVS